MKSFLKFFAAAALVATTLPFIAASPAHATEVVPFSAAEVSAGYDGTCALSNGSVYCWGINDGYEAGDPSRTSASERKPVKVVSNGDFHNENVTIISAGEYNHCAVEGGSVYCWGWNAFGVLGTGDSNNSALPILPAANDGFTNTNVTVMETSDSNTCAIERGVLYCWGYNGDGKVGIGTNSLEELLPKKVTPTGAFQNTAVTAVDVGRRGVCALEGGKMFCWGYNEFGQLGTGDTTDRNLPTAVQANPAASFVNEDITAITNAEFFSCAVRVGVAFCWGHNSYGELGNGDTTESHLPIAVHGNDGFTNTAVTAILGHEWSVCALEAARLYCWGDNTSGQLGVDNTVDGHLPVKALAHDDFHNESVTGLAVGDSMVCAIEAHRVFCTGDLADDYADMSHTWAPGTYIMMPVWGQLSPRNSTLNLGTIGYTEWDQSIYDQGLPKEVRKLTSIKMLHPFQTATQKLVSQTPTVCLTAQDQVMFLKPGACTIRATMKATGAVLYTRSTTVTTKSIDVLGVGNPVAPIKKVMFEWETKKPRKIDAAEWDRIKGFLAYTRIAFVIGYTHIGTGNKTSEAFSKSRARIAKRRLSQPGVSIEIFGLGANNPVTQNPSQKKQMKNERVVIYMIGTNIR